MNCTHWAHLTLCAASCNGLMIIWVNNSNGMLTRRHWYPELPSCLEKTILPTRYFGVYLNLSCLLCGYFCSIPIDTSSFTSCFIALIMGLFSPYLFAPRIGWIWLSVTLQYSTIHRQIAGGIIIYAWFGKVLELGYTFIPLGFDSYSGSYL